MPVKNATVRQTAVLQKDGSTYVDVRSVPEFAQGHPVGAVNVPLLHYDDRTGQMAPNREFLAIMHGNFPTDAKLLIGCQIGGRSAEAAQLLASIGYTDVTNVLGGYGGAHDEGWTQAGLPVETEATPGASYEALRNKSGASR